MGGPEGNIGLERVVRTFLNIKLRSLATRANKHKVGSQRTGHHHNSSHKNYSVLSGSFQPTVTSAWRLEQHQNKNVIHTNKSISAAIYIFLLTLDFGHPVSYKALEKPIRIYQ